MQTIKLVAVGDAAVGKTSLFISYAMNKFSSEWTPTVADSYADKVAVGEQTYLMGLFDTAGQGEYDHLRPLSYPQTDVFLVCFKVTSASSFENVRNKWVPEVRHHCPRVPFLLVGTQVDLRPSYDGDYEKTGTGASKAQQIATEEGERLARDVGAAAYLECSAKTRVGVLDVFNKAATVGVSSPDFQREWRKARCVVL
ncbi:small GTPase superfamily [Mycena filopes]|nr:small GTPase superfamily [Mycena filopes]